jgi:hypothetical protein
MSTSGLWRTARPRFPMYSPDGRGRDYYIIYDNAGYWANQFSLKKKVDYHQYRYRNFHSLTHKTAPFKYWGNGQGRETYILKTNGLFHDQKPLCTYKLSDFLRTNDSSERSYDNNKKTFLTVSEKKYKNKLRKIEKKLIKRLYTIPINMKKSLSLKNINSIKNDYFSPKKNVAETFNVFERCDNEFFKKSKNQCKIPTLLRSSKLNNFNGKDNLKDMNNKKRSNKLMKISKTCAEFFKNRLGKKDNKDFVGLNSDSDMLSFDNSNKKNTLDYKNKSNKKLFLSPSPSNYIKEENDLRFIDPRSKYNRTMKINFNYKPRPKDIRILKIKKIKVN